MTIEEVEKFFKEFSSSPLSRFCYRKDGEELLLEKGNPSPMFMAPGMAPASGMPPAPGMPPKSAAGDRTASAQKGDAEPEKAKAASDAAPEEQHQDKDIVTVKSPMVGVFYAAESPDSAPFVTEGAAVKAGDVLCLIETMKMMSEVTAPVSGTITKVLAANEDHVEYDKPLFEIRKDVS